MSTAAPGAAAGQRDRYVRARDNTVSRSLKYRRRHVGGGGQLASDDHHADAPAGDDRADIAVGAKLRVCWQSMPKGDLKMLLHAVEP